MVMTSAAMLNTVRNQGYRSLTLNVHCAHTPATPTIMACSGPSSTSAMSAVAYDVDSVDPLLTGSGSVTFHTEITHENTVRKTNRMGRVNVVGKDEAISAAPVAITDATKIRAARG